MTPREVFIAAGQYDAAGRLVRQLPSGNRDANLDAAEFLRVPCDEQVKVKKSSVDSTRTRRRALMG